MQGTKKDKVGTETLEVAILYINREPRDSFELIGIDTSQGRIDCHYYMAKKADKGVIMVGELERTLTPLPRIYILAYVLILKFTSK